MANKSIIANKIEDTRLFAQKCAQEAKSNDIFCLQGPMGAGKSEFARAFIRTLMEDDKLDVPSPTFTLVQTYETKNSPIWHFDLYRLEDAEEIYEIGWEEAVSSGISLIEWPERLGALLPANRIDITFEPIDENSRKITYHDHNERRT